MSERSGRDGGALLSCLASSLSESSAFDLIGIGVEIAGALEGFAIGERIQERWLLSHFGIANQSSIGCSDSLLHQLARRGAKLGCTHLNYQEDLGDPGLRSFKMICAPSGFLRKFSVSRKGKRMTTLGKEC